MTELPVKKVLCRRAHDGKQHLLTLILEEEQSGVIRTIPVSFFQLWARMGWDRWTERRMAAVRATAPKTACISWEKRGRKDWAYLRSPTIEPWIARIARYLKYGPEPTEVEVAADAALCVFQCDVSAALPAPTPPRQLPLFTEPALITMS